MKQKNEGRGNMPRQAQEFTYTIYVGGKPVDELTPEQLDRMADRLSETMSTYYTAHPEEYAEIKTAS